MTGSRRSSSRGFSLLEVTVALAIMALCLGMLYRVAGSGVRTVSETTKFSDAVLLAESLLATRDLVETGGWNESGQAGEFRWTIASEPYSAITMNPGAVGVQRVRVEVLWSEGARQREFSLVTLLPTRRDGG